MEKEERDIPVGKPLDNNRLYIIDKQFNRLPPGALGELWISGPHVTRSYLNRPEKTVEIYISNPFSDEPKFARIYRTGDIVRYLPDGNIHFVGRRDSQVKIRGFRIELKEIETVIRQFQGVKDATVQALEKPNGSKYVAAWVVGDEKIDLNLVKGYVGESLPPYMVPSAMMQIDRIPLNQNQKVNKRLLPVPEVQIDEQEYVAPEGEVETLLCKIFADVLSLDRVGATDDFFTLGGTSLMVTRVMIEVDKAGYHVAYGDIFSNPTARELAVYINKRETPAATKQSDDLQNGADAPTKAGEASYDYRKIEEALSKNTLESFQSGAPRKIGSALVTGATGYLGIHVLKTLIERDDVPEIWCMVRAQSQEKAERRLKGLLFYYFGNNYKELFGTRLHVVVGDLTAPISLPLQGGAGGGLSTVFNCAAVVKHFSNSADIEDVNVGGAENCIKYCQETGARLIHVSTYSTAGLSVDGVPGADALLTEQKLYYGQNVENRYVHSKFMSERKVLEAIASGTLDGKVMRVGNLAPRSADGEF